MSKRKRTRKTINDIYKEVPTNGHKYGKDIPHQVITYDVLNWGHILLSSYRDGVFHIKFVRYPNATFYGEMPNQIDVAFQHADNCILIDKKGWMMVLFFDIFHRRLRVHTDLFRVCDSRIVNYHVGRDAILVFQSADRTINVFDCTMAHLYRSVRFKHSISYVDYVNECYPCEMKVGQRGKATKKILLFNKTLLIKKLLTYIIWYDLKIETFYPIYYGCVDYLDVNQSYLKVA